MDFQPESMLKLDRLPIEIIHQIALSGSLRALLSVTSTNRFLREVCLNEILIKKIARRQYLSEVGEQNIELYCRSRPHLQVEMWARYCEALTKGMKIDHTKVAIWQKRQKDFRFIDYLPQLIILGCKPSGHNGNDAFFINANPPLPKLPALPALRFALPFRRSRRVIPDIKMYLEPEQDDRLSFCFASAMVDLYHTENTDVEIRPFIASLSDLRLTSKDGLSDGDRAKINVVVGAFAYALKSNWSQRILPCPLLARLPLRNKISLAHLPVPFAENGASNAFAAWLAVQSYQLTDPDELEHGEWCGYYSYGFQFHHIDAPMRDVSFSVERGTENPRIDGEHFEVRARGFDGIGDFSLSGAISRAGGARLVKRYVGGPSWAWTCIMTPFGLCGYWCNENTEPVEALYGGFLWLWKQEWC